MKKYSVNEIAKTFNISTSKIRYYDNIGLISLERDTSSNYRYFSDDDVFRLAKVILLRSLEFTIEDTVKILGNSRVMEKYIYKQTQLIEEKIESLIHTRDVIYSMIRLENLEITDDLFSAIHNMKEKEYQMTKVNYNEVSSIYDKVREEDIEVIDELIKEAALSGKSRVLDIGCGTANYSNAIERLTGAQVYGIDPSKGMLEKARQKNKNITFDVATAEKIPHKMNFFDLIYMTDVIHHIPDIGEMFAEIYRITNVDGKVCICTQSHRQIDKRFMSEFFPETAIVDKKRYPTIFNIIKAGEEAGLKFMRTDVVLEDSIVEVGDRILRLVENKGYSMLHQISEEAYKIGAEKMKNTIAEECVYRKSAGGSLVWFRKIE
ncbi:MAG: methyltransferase domain-containing protein [Clostridiales bacterium]|nr:methyltransferase domain-containing protein [Clostridiales bacterium]